MPRNLSTAALNEINSIDSGEVFLLLLTLVDTSSKGFDPIYIVNNNADITSQGQVYTAYAFSLILADDTGETLPQLSLTMDNVDVTLVEGMRSYTSPPQVSIQLIMASAPDNPEIEINDLVLRGVEYDKSTIRGTLIVEDVLNQKFPADRVTQTQYAGLF